MVSIRDQLWTPDGKAHTEFGYRWSFKKAPPAEWMQENAHADVFLVALEKGAVNAAGERVPLPPKQVPVLEYNHITGKSEPVMEEDPATGNLLPKLKDEPNNGYYYLPFTLAELVALLESARNRPSHLNFYEYLMDTRPRRITFDLEFMLKSESHMQRAAALWPTDYETVFADKALFLQRTLVDVVLPLLSKLAGVKLRTEDCYVCDSTQPAPPGDLFPFKKLSFHVAFDIVLPDVASRLAFHNWVHDSFRRGADTAARHLSPLLDCGVYGNGRPMRLVGCNKTGKAVWLLPVNSVGDLTFHASPPFNLGMPFTQELVAAHMWSALPGRGDFTVLHMPGAIQAPYRPLDRAPATVKQKNPIPSEFESGLQDLEFSEAGIHGSAQTDHEWRFRYAGVCPLCHLKTHTSNYALWTSDGRLFVKSYSLSCPAGKMLVPTRSIETAPPNAAMKANFTWHLPLTAGFYAKSVVLRHQRWALLPCQIFATAHHTFLVIFTVVEGGKRVHDDGRRRVLGVTDENRIVLGVKHQAKPYDWMPVEHWFDDVLRVWFLEEHAPLVAELPPPEVSTYGRPPLWTLSCCEKAACKRSACRKQTRTPWLFLRQLKAHRGSKE